MVLKLCQHLKNTDIKNSIIAISTTQFPSEKPILHTASQFFKGKAPNPLNLSIHKDNVLSSLKDRIKATFLTLFIQ